jgi:2-oxoglutarate dehydrogenase E1 component
MNSTFGENQALVEGQFRLYHANPNAVDADWQQFFEALSPAQRDELLHGVVGHANGSASGEGVVGRGTTSNGEAVSTHDLTAIAWRMSRLVTAFRSRGHYFAQIDPLGLSNESSEDFDPALFGITPDQLDIPVATDIAALPTATPRQMLEFMWSAYCGAVGYEIMHVEAREERQWLLNAIEGRVPEYEADRAFLAWVLDRLTDAQEMERFIHTQYIGVKRFSLEGLEMVIPMMAHMIDRVGDQGVEDVVIGMAHRGRLNVLTNILKKSQRELFSEFDDVDEKELVGRGDVKYHLGHSADHVTPAGNKVHISLCFNPSHLEFVNPVVVGRVRAKMDHSGDTQGKRVCPIAIHGDAAFMGQGVVAETLNLAELEGYRTGGTINIVLNNQVGFTTSPSDSRSSRYASDLARFLRVPVFHVNAEDPEAMTRVARIAADWRQTFGRDVVIDLVGYRKFGHNEGDEPRFTQPGMYGVIDDKASVRDALAERFVNEGIVSAEESEAMVTRVRDVLTAALAEARENPSPKMPTLGELKWAPYAGGADSSVASVDTTWPLERLQQVLTTVTHLGDDLHAHKKVQRIYKQRADIADGSPMDWGTAEMLAFATLVAEGHRVRVTGQDSRRGTFSHRHAYVVDSKTGARYTTLNRVAQNGGKFEAYDSPLSEAAVLGFEYGYSLESPNDLVVWEAQFGDFANGAQVIIDQFISAGEDKWGLLTGLVMLLPHGYEGQGPEHSYARLGRFLQLCAEDNMQVVDCTTPAQFFHLLRRQVLRPWRKPCVVMSPKSLLRHKRASSTLAELASGGFQKVIPDVSGVPTRDAKRVLFCSGRIYYDLEEEREQRGATDVHIIRLEQLYPLDAEALTSVLAGYQSGTELVWVQDEPWNMGAWYFIKARLQALYGDTLPIQCVARAESASPATGSKAAHLLEHKTLMDAAFRRTTA